MIEVTLEGYLRSIQKEQWRKGAGKSPSALEFIERMINVASKEYQSRPKYSIVELIIFEMVTKSRACRRGDTEEAVSW